MAWQIRETPLPRNHETTLSTILREIILLLSGKHIYFENDQKLRKPFSKKQSDSSERMNLKKTFSFSYFRPEHKIIYLNLFLIKNM